MKQLLGGLTPHAFMQRHWQKEPLLIRNAFPDFVCPVTVDDVCRLASDPLVESRLITRFHDHWKLKCGPVTRVPSLKRRMWTILVQGLNLHVPEAHALMRRFSFIPDARIDDIMISLASPGGGVGPHTDNYDVFLLQASGKRRWKIQRNPKPGFLPDYPVKLLAQFEPEEEWLLEPGDMLYLPPNVAHDGIAEGADPCMTISIGFRTPTWAELADGVAHHLAETLGDGDFGHYTDPALKPSTHSALIPKTMLRGLVKGLVERRPSVETLESAIGAWLSEPKSSTLFQVPQRPLGRTAFKLHARKRGLRLDIGSKALYAGHSFHLNGETSLFQENDALLMAQFFNQRALNDLENLTEEAWNFLYSAYASGWIHLQNR